MWKHQGDEEVSIDNALSDQNEYSEDAALDLESTNRLHEEL